MPLVAPKEQFNNRTKAITITVIPNRVSTIACQSVLKCWLNNSSKGRMLPNRCFSNSTKFYMKITITDFIPSGDKTSIDFPPW